MGVTVGVPESPSGCFQAEVEGRDESEGRGGEGRVLRDAAWPLVGGRNSSRLPGPAVSAL